MKKKITALVLVVAVLAMLFTGMTLAYFTDTDSAVNVFTVGNVKIDLEETVSVTGVDGKDYSDDRVVVAETGAIFTGIMPGNYMEKTVSVTNEENPAYVRVVVILNNHLETYMALDYNEKTGTDYDASEKDIRYTEVFDNWGITFENTTYCGGVIPETHLDGQGGVEVFGIDTAIAMPGDYYLFDSDNYFTNEVEQNASTSEMVQSYEGGHAAGVYAPHLNNYERVYVYYMAMDKGEKITLFDGLYCPTWFDQEDAKMFQDLNIEIYAAAIQQEGFVDANGDPNPKAAFEQLNSEYSITDMRAAVTPPVKVDSADALADALEEGGYIELVEDVPAGETVEIPAGTEAEIDLNGNTINNGVYNYGDVAISSGTIDVDFAGFQNEGTATLTDVVMNAGTAADYSNISLAGSETTYDNVTINSAGGGIAAVNGAKVTFNSGSLKVNSTSTSGRYLFYTEGAGSEITINGGEFSFDKTQNQKRAYIYAGTGTTVYVNGGTFGPASTRSGYTAGIMGDGTVIITGGTFGFDPSTWVADGYVANNNGDGTYTVTAQ